MQCSKMWDLGTRLALVKFCTLEHSRFLLFNLNCLAQSDSWPLQHYDKLQQHRTVTGRPHSVLEVTSRNGVKVNKQQTTFDFPKLSRRGFGAGIWCDRRHASFRSCCTRFQTAILSPTSCVIFVTLFHSFYVNYLICKMKITPTTRVLMFKVKWVYPLISNKC